MKRRTFLKVAGMLVMVGPMLRFKDALAQGPFRPVLIWDPRRCLGCKACMAACQDSRGLPPEDTVLRVVAKAEGTYPKAHVYFEENVCRQCAEAPCLSACNQQALWRTPEGVVVVDQDLCVGDGRCVAACPEKGVVLSQGRAAKCDLCLPLLRQGELPRCVAVCPSGALIFGNLFAPQGPLAKVLASSPELRRVLRKYQETKIPPEASYPPFARCSHPQTPLPDKDTRIVTTVCLACNARCGLRVWVKGQRPFRIEGNPYHPYNRSGQPLPYQTDFTASLRETGGICAKPLFDQDYVENPYRILQPLKRSGPRGSGRFEPISWEQLIREIAEGGTLFAHLGDRRHYPGLKEILSDEPLDPKAPELGPKRNQFVWLTGRSQAGRKEFIKRFVYQAVGSANCIGHTDICGLGFRMGNLAFTNGKAVELKADLWQSRYVLVFGANLYAALQPGPPTAGSVLAQRAAAGEVKFVIIDPRAHEATAAASEWIPVRPGKDGALALGLLRVLLEEKLFDEEFLSVPNLETAKGKGRNVFTNATHLVFTQGPKAGSFCRVKDLEGIEGDPEDPVVLGLDLKPCACSTLDCAVLSWTGEIQGHQVKTAFRLLEESILAHDLDFYAQESGVCPETIRRLAREFAQHAPYSAAFAYHGGGNYVGGAYASYAIALLNALVGNVNRRGGYLCAGGGAAPWRKGYYDLKTFVGALKPRGIKISREKWAYENTSEFARQGYPAKLPWFPFTKGGLSVSALAGIDQAYPYPIKILFTYFFDPIYTIPGGRRFIRTLKDPKRVPLHVSIDVTINETNIYADYIVPDVTYLEGQYGFLTPHAPGQRFTAVRTPVLAPKTGHTQDKRPFCLETLLIDLACYLGLPGFGEQAIPSPKGNVPLKRAEDFYLRGIANLVINASVPKASAREKALVETYYPVAAFKDILSPDEWARVCTVLLRGGVFLPEEAAFDAHGNLKKGVPLICIWNEKLARSTSGLCSQRFWGTACYQRACDALGRLIEEEDENFPLVLISHKTALHTQSRTICYRQALAYEGEPLLLLNPEDAQALGLSSGDMVRIRSRSLPQGVLTRVKVTPLVRPGVAAYPFHYGHTQHGVSPLEIKGAEKVLLGGKNVAQGTRVLPDHARARGFNPNHLSRLDESLFELPLLDLLGGIPDFSSTRITVERVRS